MVFMMAVAATIAHSLIVIVEILSILRPDRQFQIDVRSIFKGNSGYVMSPAAKGCNTDFCRNIRR